jgi:hypothetical protein
LADVLFKMPNGVNGINVTSILVEFLGVVGLIAVARRLKGRSLESFPYR